MSSDQNGAFHGEVIIPNGSSSISMTPFIDTIGPAGQAQGGQDLTIDPPEVIAVVDTEPPWQGRSRSSPWASRMQQARS